MDIITDWIKRLSSIDFWIQFLDAFQNLGPLAPILLALIESLIPALPLVAIVAFNIASHGVVAGFIYSWIGSLLGSIIVFSFFRYVMRAHFSSYIEKSPKLTKALNWVAGINMQTLFLISMMPFTPSSFVNVAFGLSKFNPKIFIATISVAKLFMMATLAFFGNSVVLALENPWYLLMAGGTLLALYLVSRYINKKHDL